MPFEGREFNHYRVLRLIGSGGMGEVYLAADTRIRRQVAVKIMRIEESLDDTEEMKDTLRLFLREATAIAGLDHPNILPLYDYGEDSIDTIHFAYLITPYRAEGSLANWLRKRAQNPQTRQLTLQQVAHIIQEAGKALQYAHDHQVIHQDIKPANFLIRSDAENSEYPGLQLADFGIARLTSATSHSSQHVRGTPTYMAPEQWAGQAVFASDQYALGIMTYELVTGNPPFRGAPMQIMYAHLQTPAQSPRELNPLLPAMADSVILRALAKQPEERFPSVADFAQALRRACQGAEGQTTLRSLAPVPATPSGEATAPESASRGDSDISATLAISPTEAASGSVRTIMLPGGRAVSVQIPPGAQEGQVLKLAGEGDTSTLDGASGHLYLRLSIVDPRTQRPLPSNEPSATWEIKPAQLSAPPEQTASSLPSPVAPAQAATPRSANPTLAAEEREPVESRQPGYMPPAPPSQNSFPYQEAPRYGSTPYPAYQETPTGSFITPPPRDRQKRSPLLIIGLVCLTALILGAGSYYLLASRWPWSGTQRVNSGAGMTISATPANAAPAAQQIVRLGINGSQSGDITSFDPALAYDDASIQAIQMIFTGLVQLNDQGQVIDQLAQSHTISADGLTYTFHLRANLKFSDGTPLTSQDVAYSLDRALSPDIISNGGQASIYLGLLKDAGKRSSGSIPTLLGDSIITPDALTIALVLSKPAGYFLASLASPAAFVVEKSLIDKYGLKWTDHLNENGGQGGDGPFKVASYSHSTGITFVPNASYYGPQPLLQRVEFLFYAAADTSYTAYQTGQLDTTRIPPASYTQARQSGQAFHQFSLPLISYVGMNYLYKPFDNIAMRQAFAAATNRDILDSAIYQGSHIPTCHIIPPGTPGYANPNLQCPANTPTGGDNAKALALFNQGLQQEHLTTATFPPITLTYPSGNAAIEKEAALLAQMWQTTLGITVKTQALEFATFINQLDDTICTQSDPANCLNHGLSMWLISYLEDYPDPQDWTGFQFGKDAGLNNAQNYGHNLCSCLTEQEQTQQLMERADGEIGTERFSLYNQIEQKLVNNVAWLSIDQSTSSYLLKPYVSGFSYNIANQTPPNDWGHIYILAH